MTERPRAAVRRDADSLCIGPSSLHWDGRALTIAVAERSTQLMNPYRYRVEGTIRIDPEMLNGAAFALDPAGRHHWRAIAPRARITVDLKHPALSWRGSAYCDSNQGTEPLEAGFADWQWSRAHLGSDVAVLYEGVRRDGSPFASALRFGADGVPREAELPPVAPLPRTWWTMQRQTRSDTGFAYIGRTWEDSPFYARSTLSTRIWGEQVEAVHESLSLDRFRTPVVQWMLPYRMPRARG